MPILRSPGPRGLFEWPLGAIAIAFYCVALAFDIPELRELSRLWHSSSPEAHGFLVAALATGALIAFFDGLP